MRNTRLLLMALILLVGISFFTQIQRPIRAHNPGHGDLLLWQNVIDRMRSGESYYSAMEAALRTTGNYPLRPFWSFRLPALASFIGLIGNFPARIILIGLAVLMIFFWSKILFEAGSWVSLLIGVVLLSFIVTCAAVQTATVWHDLWAGILIAISIALYSQNKIASFVCAIIAISLRIHVAVFILVMLIFALREKRYSEIVFWVILSVSFLIYVALHAYFVSSHAKPDDPTKTWTAFGGWSFVIATTRWTLPGIIGFINISGMLLPVSVLSLVAWNHPSARRAAGTMLGYICAFMIMGNADNDYWGLLYSPLWAIGVAYSPIALKDFIKSCSEDIQRTTHDCSLKIQ